jgi:Spy/CpxP family protein refolding chaperone
MTFRGLAMATLLLSLATEGIEAQGMRRRERLAQPNNPQQRQQLEQQLRTGVARVVKQRLELTDDQMMKLRRSNAQFEPRRRSLNQEERQHRRELRSQILAGPTADQTRIGAAVDDLLQLQRRRIDLQIEEQRQLAEFMTPMQRARYLALQEQLRRRVEGIQKARPDSVPN